MGDDELSPQDGGNWGDGEEPTRVRRPRSEPPGAAGDDPYRELPHILETQRIRPDQVNRRALPFKRAGDRRGDAPAAEEEERGTGRVLMTGAPALPFQPAAEEPPFPSDPFPQQHPSAPPLSVWSREAGADAALNRAALPSALAPSLAPPGLAPPPAPRRDHTVTAIVLLLIVVLIALGGAAIVALR
jgi:hypothetical protein